MKKTAKKILSIILTVCMLLTAMTGALSMDAFASGSDPDMVRIHTSSGGWTTLKFLNWVNLPAGNYEATIQCNLLSGSMPYMNIAGGSNEYARNAQKYNNLSVATNYDEFNHVYRITFTLASALNAELGWYIGAYGNACDCFLAQPELYLLDSSGNRTGSNYVSDFCSDNYVTGKFGYGKWGKYNFDNASATISSYDASIFAVQDSVTFNGTWTKLYYCTNSRYFYDATYKLTMDMKVISGTPTVNVKNNDSSGTAVTVTSRSYDEENFKFELLFTVAAAGDLNVVFEIGNEGSAANFTVASPRCYRLDSGNPVSKGIFAREFGNYDDSYNPSDGFSGHTDKWCRRGSGRTCNTLTTSTFSHEISGTDKSLYVRQLNNVNALLTTQTTVESGQTYLVECDWKAYGGAMPRAFISYNNGSWTDITSSATADTGYITDGASGSQYYESNTGAYSFANMGATQGHYAVKVTIGSTDVWASNFKLGFGATVYNWSAANYGRGEFYITNVSLKKVGGTGANLIKDPTFKSLSGDYTNAGSFSTYWNKEISRSGSGDRKYFSSVKFIEVPASLYTDAGITENPKMITFNGGNWEGLYQGLELEPSTTYHLTYQAISVNGGLVQQTDYFDGSTWQHINRGGNEDLSTDANGNTSYTFTTPASASMSSNAQETYRILFLTNTNSPEQRFNLANVQLYKWNGSANVGPNLVSNGNFYFGTETTLTDLHTEYTNYESYFKVHYANSDSLLGWRLVTKSEDEHKLEQNQGIVVSDYKSEDFPAVITTQAGLNTTLSQLYHIVLGNNATTESSLIVSKTNPYQNVDADNDYDIIDIVLLDMAAYESVPANTVQDVDKAKNDIVAKVNANNNVTDLTQLASDGLLATPVTGTTYYVDSSSGSNSNNGTSKSTPWKDLTKVNSASLKSGDCVLFRCGTDYKQTSTSKDINASLECVAGVTYGSYRLNDSDSTAKPTISGSYRSWASTTNNYWRNESGNLWYCTGVRLGDSSSTWDVGQLYFGVKNDYDATIGTMVATKADLKAQGQFWAHNVTSSSSDEKISRVYMYSVSDPDSYYSDIEIAQKINVCNVNAGCTLNNLHFTMGGEHGISAGSADNICISQCIVSNIGGTYNNGVRFGNGIQFGQHGKNITVKNNYVFSTYDSAITFQSYIVDSSDKTSFTWENVNFLDNYIDNCYMGLEFFMRTTDQGYNDQIKNCNLSGNVITNTASWSYNQRLSVNDESNRWACSAIKVGQDRYYADGQITNFNITNNIIYKCAGPVIWWSNPSGETRAITGVNFSGNSWYQYDYRTVYTNNETVALTNYRLSDRVYGSSTGALRAAIADFEANPKVVRYLGEEGSTSVINLPIPG